MTQERSKKKRMYPHLIQLYIGALPTLANEEWCKPIEGCCMSTNRLRLIFSAEGVDKQQREEYDNVEEKLVRKRGIAAWG